MKAPLDGAGPVILPNVWLGVSVENQKWADIRIPALLDTPAAVRWVSMEPLLGPVDLMGSGTRPKYWLTGEPTWGPAEPTGPGGIPMSDLIIKPGLDWVVLGGESGAGARAMHPDWARSIRDQCAVAGVPFLFKQWGMWGPAPWKVDRIEGETDAAYKARAEATGATHVHTQNPVGEDRYHLYEPDYKPWSAARRPMSSTSPYAPVRRWGKTKAGRELDGQVWDQYPQAVAA
jgi:protein gp37